MKESREFGMMCLTTCLWAALIAVGTGTDLAMAVRVLAWAVLVPSTFAIWIALRNYRQFAKRYHAEAHERFEQRLRDEAEDGRRQIE